MPAALDTVSTGERVLVLVRAINVGGASMLPMADLRAAAAGLGHTDVATHLATGNLLLVPAAGSATTAHALAAQLTTDLADALGRPLALTVRTPAQVDAIIAGNPYPDVAEDDPAHLVVMFFDGPVTADQPDLARYGRERATWAGDDGYLHYPDGIGRSKVTAGVITRLAGRQGTGRNWRTVQALHHKLTS